LILLYANSVAIMLLTYISAGSFRYPSTSKALYINNSLHVLLNIASILVVTPNSILFFRYISQGIHNYIYFNIFKLYCII